MRLLRSILAALAALSLAAPAHALTPSQKWGAPHIVTPSGDPGTPAANFDVGNGNFAMSAGYANYLTDGGPGAWYAPNTGIYNSWSLIFKFQMPLNSPPNASQESSNQNIAIFGGCSSSCSGGTDKGVWITGLANSTAGRAGELEVYAFNSTLTLWTPPSSCGPGGIYSCVASSTQGQTGISNLIPGHTYCAAIYQYGADSGSSGTMEIRVVDTTGNDVPGSPVTQSTPNNSSSGTNFYTTSGSPRSRSAIGDIFGTKVGVLNTTTAADAKGNPGPLQDLTMLYGVPEPSKLGHLCDGTLSWQGWYNTLSSEAVGSHYALNPVAGVTLADTANSPVYTTNLTATTATSIYAATPLTKSNAIQMTEVGAADIFRVDSGLGTASATGTIYISGTYNAATLGGNPAGIQARVLQGGNTVVGWTRIAANPTGGTFTGKISGVPANYLQTTGPYTANATPYTIDLRVQNAPSFVYSSKENIYIGLEAVDAGQSQMALMAAVGNSASTNSIAIPSTDIALVNNMTAMETDPLSVGAPYATSCVTGYSGCINGPQLYNLVQLKTLTNGGNQPGVGSPGVSCTGSNAVTAFSYVSGTGAVTLTLTNPVGVTPGDTVQVTGLTGTGSIASANATTLATSGTTGSTLTYTIATGLTLTWSSGGSVNNNCAYTALGDGNAQEIVSLEAVSNLPVKLVNLARSGTPVDAWIEGYQQVGGSGATAAQNMTCSPNCTSPTSLSYTATMTNLVNPATNTSGATQGQPWVANFFYSVLPGSVKVYDTNGCMIANDAGAAIPSNNVGAFNLTSGGCSGTGAVTGGTLNYGPSGTGGAFVPSSPGLTFASGPVCTPNPCTIAYTTIYDGWTGSYARQVTQSHGLFSGIDMWGSTPQNGDRMAAMQTVTGPPSLWYVEQASANSGQLNGVPINNLSATSVNFNVFQKEWDWVVTNRFENFWWAGGNTMQLGVGGHPRDNGATLSQANSMEQFFLNWGSGADSTTNAIYGGTYEDNDLQSLIQGTNNVGPHANYSVFGSARIGRRRGVYDWYLMQGQPIAGSAIVTTGNTHTTTTLDGLGSLSGAVRVGMYVVGSQFAAGTYVTAINSTSSVTLSTAALGTATGTSVTFGTNYTASTGYEPYPVKIAYNTLTTGNHNAGCGTTGACIDITVALGSLSSGTALDTCGTNISGGNYPATGVCAFTGAVGTVVKGFSFGLSTGGTFYRENGDDDASTTTVLNNGATPALDYGSTCTIISTSAPLVVECVMDAPSLWTVGSTYLKYSPQFNRNGSLASIAVAGGSGYSGCATICNVPLVGTGCTNASVDEWQVGGVVHAVRHERGSGCTVTVGTVALSGSLTGGSGASITPTIASPATDLTDISYYLYDNAGGFGASSAAAGSEPGYPFTTQNLALGPF